MGFVKNLNFRLYLLFWGITFAFYFITFRAGFVTDFMGWMHQFDNYSFKTVINSENYSIKSFYQFTHLIMYAMTSVFRISPVPWFLLFSSLFALNSLLVFKLFQKIFTALKLENGNLIAFIGVLFFMLSPYQAEVMVWRASFHYLTAFAMMLGIVHLSLKYVEKPSNTFVFQAISIFFCSIFALEYFLFTPFFVLIILIFWFINFPNSFVLKKTAAYFVGIPLSMVGFYFILYRFLNGKWVGHYGLDDKKSLISPESFATYGKYVAKHLFFIRNLEHKTKEQILGYFDTPSVSWAILVGVFAAAILGIVFREKMSVRGKIIFLNFGLFSLLIAPVLTLYFSWALNSENDRYGYMPSAFLCMGVAVALSKLPKSIFYGISIGYILLSSVLLVKINRMWWKSEKVLSSCIKDFRWESADEVFVLAAPDNYAGVPIFRSDWVSSTLQECIETDRKHLLKTHIFDVMQYNLTTPSDGVNVKVISENELVVTLNQWGNWWFRKGIGAESYETADFIVKNDFDGCGRCYKLTMKNTKPNRAFIFQTGNVFKEVDWTKLGIEQR